MQYGGVENEPLRCKKKVEITTGPVAQSGRASGF